MKRPYELATAGLFFGAAAFISGAFGLTILCVLAVVAMLVLELLALHAWNEVSRYREMRGNAGLESDLGAIRRANGIQQGAEWDAKGKERDDHSLS